MSDFTVKSDSVDVEQIMRQVRSRIREKRGVDYTEDEIRELASVKLERFLDPKGVRSDLLEQYRKRRDASTTARNYTFEDTTLYESSRPLLRGLRKLLNPLLKLFFNPTPVVEALHIQSKLNELVQPGRVALLRADPQPGPRNHAARHRGEEPQDAGGVDVEPAGLRRASCARARGRRAVSPGQRRTAAAARRRRWTRTSTRRCRPMKRSVGHAGAGVAADGGRADRVRVRRGIDKAPGRRHEPGRGDGGESSGPSGETGNGPAES